MNIGLTVIVLSYSQTPTKLLRSYLPYPSPNKDPSTVTIAYRSHMTSPHNATNIFKVKPNSLTPSRTNQAFFFLSLFPFFFLSFFVPFFIFLLPVLSRV